MDNYDIYSVTGFENGMGSDASEDATDSCVNTAKKCWWSRRVIYRAALYTCNGWTNATNCRNIVCISLNISGPTRSKKKSSAASDYIAHFEGTENQGLGCIASLF